MPILQGIAYEELPGSGLLEYSPQGIVGRRQFKVDWTDRLEFCRILLGYTTATGHIPRRVDAQQWPGLDYLYCTHAREKHLGDLRQGTEMASYPEVEIHTEYRPWNYEWSPGETDDEDEVVTYLEESRNFGAEFVNTDGDGYNFADAPFEAVTDWVGRLVGTEEIILHSPWEPEYKAAEIRACNAHVNNAPFYQYPAQHVLCLAPSARRVITSEGTPGWAVTYRFKAREESWNYIFSKGVWREITPHPYTMANFAVLFDA